MPNQSPNQSPNLHANQPRFTSFSRRGFLATLSAAAGSAALATLASPASAMRLVNPASASTLLPWDEIAPGFHALINPNTGGNSLAVVSASDVLLIDTKFAYLAGALKQDALSFPLTRRAPTLTLINTHHHGDHTGGNALIIPTATNSYAHKNAIPRIKSQLDNYKQTAMAGPSQLKRMGKPFDTADLFNLATAAGDASSNWTESDITPKTEIDQTQTLTVGSIPLALHHFGPGHTDNDLVVHFPDHNIIHTGDLVFNNLHPYFDPTGGYSAKGWISVLTKVLEFCDPNTKVIPGHGPAATKTAIESQRTYLQSLIEHVQQELDKGTEKEQIMDMNWDFMQGLGFEAVRPRAISAVYDELQN